MKDTLTKHEWLIMEAFWNKHPLTLSQVMQALRHAVDWKSSTFNTYLRKMAEKGYLGFEMVSGNRAYFPLVEKEACLESESRSMLHKLPGDSAATFLTCMIKESGLTQESKAELKQLIDSLENKDGET